LFCVLARHSLLPLFFFSNVAQMNNSSESMIGAQHEHLQHGSKEINVHTKELGVGGSAHSDDGSGSPIPSQAMTMAEKWWIFEIFAWLLGTIGLIAIIIILRSTEGKPIPDWKIGDERLPTPPLAVNINSVISIFSTLVKSTLLIPVVAGMSQLKWVWFRNGHRMSDFQVFDAANKGPLGSVILLWKFRGRNLASLGAFIVIASLGLDFAFQQLVVYPPRPIVVGKAFARTLH
jgi:hypothetical protein